MGFWLALAAVAAIFYCFVSFKTVQEGMRTSFHRCFEDARWEESFRSHRRYGKLIWVSLVLLVFAIVPVEIMLREGGANEFTGLLMTHLLFVSLHACVLVLQHVFTGLRHRERHRVLGFLYIGTGVMVIVTGLMLYYSLIT